MLKFERIDFGWVLTSEGEVVLPKTIRSSKEALHLVVIWRDLSCVKLSASEILELWEHREEKDETTFKEDLEEIRNELNSDIAEAERTIKELRADGLDLNTLEFEGFLRGLKHVSAKMGEW